MGEERGRHQRDRHPQEPHPDCRANEAAWLRHRGDLQDYRAEPRGNRGSIIYNNVEKQRAGIETEDVSAKFPPFVFTSLKP